MYSNLDLVIELPLSLCRTAAYKGGYNTGNKKQKLISGFCKNSI